MVSIQVLLSPAIRQLQAADNPSPILDAQLWLAHVCGLTRTELLTHPERLVPPQVADRFSAGLKRLVAGEPLPYLTGWVEFYGLNFQVTPDTLIPRPETEHLVEEALGNIPDRPVTIADIGTGSGCIAISLAVHRPQARLYATDVSTAALKIAAQNAARHQVTDRVTLLQGHLLEPLSHPVQAIIANLPYVADDEWDQLPIGVREYEPAGALRGGHLGLELITELLPRAPAALQTGGTILLEIGATQGEDSLALARGCFPTAEIELKQDYAGRDRVLIVQTLLDA